MTIAITQATIERCAEHGKVALVESGMDCDCVSYGNHATVLDADLKAVEAHIDSALSWADGPMHFCLMTPSEAALLKPRSRDLAAEAHEDGHPHSIHI